MPYEPQEARLQHRRTFAQDPQHLANLYPAGPQDIRPRKPVAPRLARAAFYLFATLGILAAAGILYARHWVNAAVRDSLPQLDGTAQLPGLSGPVTIARDPRGIPYIHARTLDDAVLTQGYLTAGDRLFQMDALRRHASGTLAEIFGSQLVNHDRLQRTLQIRAAADRALAQLPADQLHLLEVYAQGVNAAIAARKDHLPLEFRVLRYTPEPWVPRDSLLVALAMFQDLSTQFPTKLARESLTQRLPADLVADLYPVGSWRDHTPNQPIPDLTIPGPPIEQIPLDESQSSLKPTTNPGAPPLASERWASIQPQPSGAPFMQFHHKSEWNDPTPATILASLAPLIHPAAGVTPGSNAWAVSGAHTATGKPMLSNDMHLNLTVPGLWYAVDLQADNPSYHTAGVSIPGTPLICAGHNDHIAWGFTNLGGDVQDLYIESLRDHDEEFQAADGSWQPVVHQKEVIKVAHGLNQTLDIRLTRHGDSLTPIMNPALTPEATRGRNLSLRWTIYDPANLRYPWLAINQAHDWPSFLAATADFGGPTQNVLYADDQGHIGYHALGRIPLRGPAPTPVLADPSSLPTDLGAPGLASETWDGAATIPKDLAAPATPTTPQLSGPLSPVPLVPTPAHEWSGYIPFDKLPQAFDPPAGVLATANSRVTPDDYPYPVTLNWAAPYRNERIYLQLAHSKALSAADLLALQSDVYSDFDHVLAERLAYALDHTTANKNPQAADLLRTWNGRMTTDSPTPAIISAVHGILWPLLLAPHLDQKSAAAQRTGGVQPKFLSPAALDRIQATYTWGEKDYALEQLLQHTPARWLPPGYANWDEFLAAALAEGLREAHAPGDLSKWSYGPIHTVDLESPLFQGSPLLRRLFRQPTGTGPHPQSGDHTTIKQVDHTFGPSERFTMDLANLQNSTLNLPLGESENPLSPWFQDQFPAWLRGSTYAFTAPQNPTHTLTLTP